MNNNKILITGIAGFIGFSLAKEIARKYPNSHIIGTDNLDDYYSVEFKKNRLKELQNYQNISYIYGDISNFNFLQTIYSDHKDIELIIHLAAQTGVRNSVDQPFKYVTNNIMGQVSILEFAKLLPNLQKIIYASSSSIYGSHKITPYQESFNLQKPLSLYSVTKQADELMCSTYSRLFDIPMVGLRFFTVYGPYGRPDMAIYKIADLIQNNEQVELVGDGKVSRDFTYIDDITDGIIRATSYIPSKDSQGFQNEIFNLGSGKKTNLTSLTNLIAKYLDKKAKIIYKEPHLSDMNTTLSDISKAKKLLNYMPRINLELGIKNFIKWYKCI